MRSLSKIIVFLCFLSVTAFGQEKMTKTMAGPNGDQFRSLIAFIYSTDDTFKMQSLILDTNKVKNKKELPSSFYVDLTSTVRSLASGEKKQKILVMKWEKPNSVEVKCEGGKWAKQEAGPELDKIIEVVMDVIRTVPLDAKEPIEFALPKDLEQKVILTLDGLQSSKLSCVRNGS